jgi:hypothetical protein
VRDIALQVVDDDERNRRLKAIDDLLAFDDPDRNKRNEQGSPRWYGSDEDAWASFEEFVRA